MRIRPAKLHEKLSRHAERQCGFSTLSLVSLVGYAPFSPCAGKAPASIAVELELESARRCGAKRKAMEPDLNQERRQAHALLDMLPAEKLNAVRSLLEVMVEPLARSLALAPVEEEEITPETARALDRARTSLARGEGIPHEEIPREFGLHQGAGPPRGADSGNLVAGSPCRFARYRP